MALRTATSKPRAAILAGLVAFALLAGCRQKPQEPPLPAPDQTYTVRGRVESLPKEGEAPSVRIFHEKIPDFVSREGQVVGMNPMVMPFTPAPGLSLEGIEPGDKVEFTFEVRWKTRPFSRLVKIAELPPETELNFSR